MDIVSWSASVASVYTVDKTLTDGLVTRKFTIDQNTGGNAELVRKSANADGEGAFWEGPVAGTTRVNDKYEMTISGTVASTLTQIGNGAQVPGLALLQLTAAHSPAGGCTYSVRYTDGTNYQQRLTLPPPLTPPPGSNFDVPGTLAITAYKALALGTQPATGWKLDQRLTVPAYLFPVVDDAEELVPLIRAYYTPLLSIPATLFGMSNTNQLGTATFTFVITAAAR